MKLRNGLVAILATIIAICTFSWAGAATTTATSSVAPIAAPDISAALTNRSWSPLAKTVPYLVYTDYKTGSQVLAISSTDANSAQAKLDAEAAFGTNVVVKNMDSASLQSGTSRNLDTSPHWGAAAIDPNQYPPTFPTACSTGFAAFGAPFATWMITAGHCQQLADSVGQAEWMAHANGSLVNSWAYGLDGKYPDLDATLLFPNTNEDFVGKIWTGPDPVNPRPVSGKRGALIGDYFCESGGVSANHCDMLAVTDNHATSICNIGIVVGCINHLDMALETGIQSASGDSGSPVYFKTTSPPLGAALAAGTVTGVTTVDGNPYLLYTNIGITLNAFNITLKTCC